MASVFNALGWLAVLIGGAWSGLILFAPRAGAALTGMDVLARLVVAWPGLGLVFSGLFLLAIGGVLSRLDKIVRNTAGTAAATEALMDRGAVRQEPRF
ncbi:MAG: hypothetical protein WBA73_14020 [Devosia sp.]